jgi:S1-C subfamily serine protease
VWDKLGYIVTNFHVVEGGQRWRVRLNDGTAYDATPVGGAPNFDLAVLKIDAPEESLKPIAVGGSNDLQVGQKVLAIGNPFGLDTTLTTGVISGLEREIKTDRGIPIRGVVQTDAAINPGNSGGPLLDSSGRLIGVNTAIVSPSGAYAGIGFAIPVDAVNEMVPRLISQGSIKRPGLGVVLWPDSLARRWGRRGAIIRDVASGSSAEKAGLRASAAAREGIVLGDVIVGLDDTAITDLSDLSVALAKHEVGETVSLTILRGRQTMKLDVTLQSLDE